MTVVGIECIAKMINDDCEHYDYFWAFGLVRETIDIWKDQGRRELLCESARSMVDEIMENRS